MLFHGAKLMLDFLFSRSGELQFESLSEKELQVLELIRVDKSMAKKYYKLYKQVYNTVSFFNGFMCV